jgi:crotonobetainyl-CoA:carnitine CoA-transferase CaiB-like acyl-CoA transferase
MASALLIQNTRLMSIEATDTELRETALAKVRDLRDAGAAYKDQLAVMNGMRPAIGNIYYRCYQTADGFIAVAALVPSLQRKLLAVIGLEDWRVGKRPADIDYKDPEVQQYVKDLLSRAEALFRTRPSSEWLQALDAGGVPAGQVQFTEELLEDTQALENGYIVEFEHPLMGPVRAAGPMLQMSETPLSVQGPSPTLGQHNDDILRELGYAEDRIAALRERAVIGSPPTS